MYVFRDRETGRGHNKRSQSSDLANKRSATSRSWKKKKVPLPKSSNGLPQLPSATFI